MLILTIFIMELAVLSNATVFKPTDRSFRSVQSRRDGDANDRPGSLDWSHDGLSRFGTSCPSTSSEPIRDRSLLLHRQKKTQLWLWLAVFSTFGSSSALSLEEGRSKPAWSFCSRSSTCRRWAMAWTFWRPTRILFHRPSITHQRPSPNKSNHWTGDSGVI